jgi:hypothetical protein
MPTNHNEKAVTTDMQSADFAMTFDEIGQVLGCPRGTAWTIYHRALRKLRRSYPGILSELRDAAMELDFHRTASLFSGDDHAD